MGTASWRRGNRVGPDRREQIDYGDSKAAAAEVNRMALHGRLSRACRIELSVINSFQNRPSLGKGAARRCTSSIEPGPFRAFILDRKPPTFSDTPCRIIGSSADPQRTD